jgi:hypothetical protein
VDWFASAVSARECALIWPIARGSVTLDVRPRRPCWMLGHDEFVWVIYDYGSAMVFVLAVYVYRMIFSNDQAARAIVAGVLISFGAAWIQQSDLSVGTLFNHNDLYHLTQIAALFVFHSGAQRIRED